MEKGEIARYEQFLLFPQSFRKPCFPGASKSVIVWEWVNPLPNDKILDSSKFKVFAHNKINVNEQLKLGMGRVENIVGKEKMLFLLLLQCFQKASFSKSFAVGIVQ